MKLLLERVIGIPRWPSGTTNAGMRRVRLPVPTAFAVCHPPFSLPIACQPTVLSNKGICYIWELFYKSNNSTLGHAILSL